MTPQEQAKKLIDNYWNLFVVGQTVCERSVKECVIRLIDEILKEYNSMSDLKSIIVVDDKPITVVDKITYWRKVKEEVYML